MVKVHLTAVMQVAEHRNAAQNRQNEQEDFDKGVHEPEHLRNGSAPLLQQLLRGPASVVVALLHELELGIIGLNAIDDRQRQGCQASEHSQGHGPEPAGQVLPHQLRERVF